MTDAAVKEAQEGVSLFEVVGDVRTLMAGLYCISNVLFALREFFFHL